MMCRVVIIIPPLYFALRQKWGAFALNIFLWLLACITIFIGGHGVISLVHDAALAFGDAIFGHGVILSVLPAIAFGHAAWALVREETFEKQHEGASKKRMECFQKELNSTRGDDTALKRINARLDAQMKIEDFIVKSREANHPKLKAWGPIYASGAAIVISLAGAYASYRAIEQGWQTRTLEERKAKAEIALKAAGSSPEETRARLTALMEARLLDLSREEIETLSSLWHPKEK